jgi:hypothetical protein
MEPGGEVVVPEATCTPGQDGTVADASTPVTLQPVTGDFGEDEGTITAISTHNRQGDSMDLVGSWLPYALVAKFPDQGLGTGVADERFRIEVNLTNGTMFVADPVAVKFPQVSLKETDIRH